MASAAAVTALGVAPAVAGDRPFNTSRLVVRPDVPAVVGTIAPGMSGGGLSKVQIERFRCSSAGDPGAVVDMSCNDEKYGQDWAPDNEVAVAVDPTDPDHVVAGSNDYFYRFNNSTGARQAIVPTGFFTSFDGGATWVDGQIPMRSGNGAGDPVTGLRPGERRRAHGPAREHRRDSVASSSPRVTCASAAPPTAG